jgi:hypothetical protein
MVVVAAVGSIACLFGSSARSSFVIATVGCLLRIVRWSKGLLCCFRCRFQVFGVVGSHVVMMLGDTVVKKLMSRWTAMCTDIFVSNPLTGCVQVACGRFHSLCLPHVRCVAYGGGSTKGKCGVSVFLSLALA